MISNHARLKQALAVMQEIIPKLQCTILLDAALGCHNCNNSRYIKDGDYWQCLKFGQIPKEHLKDGCDYWVNNIGVGYKEK